MRDIEPVEILYYQSPSGKRPFESWRHELDPETRQTVDARLVRVRRGLFGEVRSLGDGVSELKLDAGPGYRIYFGRDGRALVILLHAGDKRRQSADIETAKRRWKDYLRRTRQ